MAHTWKLAIGLGLLGASLAAGCVVKEGDDDSAGGAAGEGGTSGSGGSSAKGGTGGTTGGSAGKAGGSGASGAAGKGGSAGSGTGGATGGTGGTTSDAGMAGDTGGTGGTGGTDNIVATCDPASGELDSHPYPTCAADPPGDECESCIEESCCEESKTCYGMEPYNVCGWGGPTDGPYAGLSEKGCFQRCLSDKVKEADGECLQDDADSCAADCATTMCYEGAGQFPLVGNATIDLTTCMQDHCAKKCFGAATCGN